MAGGNPAESLNKKGDSAAAFASAAKVVDAQYHYPFLNRSTVIPPMVFLGVMYYGCRFAIMKSLRAESVGPSLRNSDASEMKRKWVRIFIYFLVVLIALYLKEIIVRQIRLR